MGGSRDDAIAPTLADGAQGTAPTLAAPTGGGPTSGTEVAPSTAVDAKRYALGPIIGKGGMGVVRVARDERVGRDVAVKSLIAGEDGAHPEAVARFLREARVQGRLDHPAIVPVHDLGFDARGVPYFAMKKLAGRTLAEILDRQRAGDVDALAQWPRRTLLARLADVCLAIEFAHTRGVVHRDLKPQNLMLGDFGEVYVLDWGIAKIGDDEPRSGAGIQRSDLDTLDSVVGETAAGSVLGTPGYMAPEQARGGVIDHRVGVYALGCILFEILTLEAMLPRGMAALAAALSAEPGHPAARRPDGDIAPELDDACARATAPAAVERTPSARDLHAAVQRYLDGDRDLARRREMAVELATAASAAFDRGQREDAMRTAGRALALDPANRDAATLVGRLLLEPPEEIPPEVVASIDDANHALHKRYMLAATLAYLAYLALLPGLLWVGVKDWTIPSLMAVSATANAVFAYALSRTRTPPSSGLYLFAVVLDASLGFMSSMFFSPLMMTPGLVTASALTFLASPLRFSPTPVLVTGVTVLLLPLLLEWQGVLPSTFTIDATGIHIRSWVLHSNPTGTLVVLIGANLGLLLTVVQMALHLRRAQVDSDRRTHLTTWHLRQLVP
ncbi:MAG TPA: serine/threonine-protein kinase [Kofleriaceae bacterium]|nr:serine/threonine-protein kinase [Kofleriaceae bacterium]